MIGFVIKETTYLKMLQPIILEISKLGNKIAIFNMDSYKSDKEYNRPTKDRICKSFGCEVNLISFSNDLILLQLLKKYKIKKLISIEIGLWGCKFVSFFKANNIKTYSLLYLTDSLWQGKNHINCFDRIYYTTQHLMNINHKFNGIKYNENRDRCLGSPIFDQINNINNSNAKDTLILLPNIRDKTIFGGNKRFYDILEKFGTNLIFKTRKKQWMPENIKKLAKEIVYDDDCMFPSSISRLFPKTKATVLFNSSGIYECVFAKQYVINVKFNRKIWKWDKNKLKEYFDSDLYNFPGVVESVEQEDVLKGNVKVKELDKKQRFNWISKFIGINKYFSYELIARDILE